MLPALNGPYTRPFTQGSRTARTATAAACPPGRCANRRHGSPPVDLTEGEARLVIYRVDDDASMQQLGEAPAIFLEAIARGVGPLVALAEAAAMDRDYSLGRGIPNELISRLLGGRSREER